MLNLPRKGGVHGSERGAGDKIQERLQKPSFSACKKERKGQDVPNLSRSVLGVPKYGES
jgi:hypothetical protein